MNISSKKILITGGTGFIGNHLCDRLLKDGHRLYILTRNQKLNNIATGNNKSYFNHLSQIQNIDIDIVINLAGETIAQRWTKSAKNRIYNSRISTSRDLINFMKAQQKLPKLLISGSAVGYYGCNNDKAFTEEDIPKNTNLEFSSSLCKDWENEALGASNLGVRTVCLRIGPVIAKDGGMLAKLLPGFLLCIGSQIGSGQQWLSWIDRDDLVELIIFIIHNKHIDGAVNATSPYPVTNKEFSLALAEALHRPCFFKTPEFVFRLIFGQMAEEIMLKGQKVLPKKALDCGFEFFYPTIEQSFLKIFRSY